MDSKWKYCCFVIIKFRQLLKILTKRLRCLCIILSSLIRNKLHVERLNGKSKILCCLSEKYDIILPAQSTYAAKKRYEQNLANNIKTNCRKLYNYAKHFTRPQSSVDSLEYKGTLFSSDTEKAEILNNFFASVMVDEPDTLPHVFADNCSVRTLSIWLYFDLFHLV